MRLLTTNFAPAFAIIFAFGTASPTAAQEFEITASGTLSSVRDYGNAFDSSVASGTPFTFTFLFNNAPQGTSVTPGVYDFSLPGSGAGATVSFGDVTIAPSAASSNQIKTFVGYSYNNQNYDEAALSSSNGTATGLLQPAQAITISTDITHPAGQLSPDILPPLSFYSLNNLAFQQSLSFSVQTGSGSSQATGAFSTLTAQEITPVPEASTMISLGFLLTLGLGGVGIGAHRKRVSV